MTAAKIYRPDGSVVVPAYKATPRPPFAPFDFELGERIKELGDDYVVASPVKWADTPVLDLAWDHAKRALAGYRLGNAKAEMLVQEYYARNLLLVIVAVWGKAPGKATWQWHYTFCPFDIAGEVRAQLVLCGRWKTGTRH